MGSYAIVIGKKDGKIQVDGKGFSGLSCLEFLEKIKLGRIVEEELKNNETQLNNSNLVKQTLFGDEEW